MPLNMKLQSLKTSFKWQQSILKRKVNLHVICKSEFILKFFPKTQIYSGIYLYGGGILFDLFNTKSQDKKLSKIALAIREGVKKSIFFRKKS